MKFKNPGRIQDSAVGCHKPKKKDIKVRLRSALEAKRMIEDLHDNGYIYYEASLLVRGHIRLVVEDCEKQLKEAKDGS